MSLENLPPVWKYWEEKDLEDLTQDELEKLQLMLKLKMEVITDRFERQLFWKNRDRYMQLKTIAYRAPGKRDYPF